MRLSDKLFSLRDEFFRFLKLGNTQITCQRSFRNTLLDVKIVLSDNGVSGPKNVRRNPRYEHNN